MDIVEQALTEATESGDVFLGLEAYETLVAFYVELEEWSAARNHCESPLSPIGDRERSSYPEYRERFQQLEATIEEL